MRARAYAVDDGSKRAVFVSVDGGMGSDLVKMRVMDKLDEALGKGTYTTVSDLHGLITKFTDFHILLLG